jgi:hypothetical protein
VLKHITTLGGRIIDRRCLRGADDSVYEERHDRDHQDAGDRKRHDHLDKRKRNAGGILSNPALRPA